MVFAAASLAELFGDVEPAFARAHPEYALVFNFAGSNTLALQLLAGARADLIVSADERSLDPLLRDGLIEPPVDFARNRMALAVPADNPARIQRVDDLLKPGTRLVLAGPEVPAGRYGRAYLRRNGAAEALEVPLSDEPDVRAVVGKLLLGEADAGVVYASDLRALGDRLARVPVDEEVPVVARYPLALLRSASNPAGARALAAFLAGEEGLRLLEARAFLRP